MKLINVSCLVAVPLAVNGQFNSMPETAPEGEISLVSVPETAPELALEANPEPETAPESEVILEAVPESAPEILTASVYKPAVAKKPEYSSSAQATQVLYGHIPGLLPEQPGPNNEYFAYATGPATHPEKEADKDQTASEDHRPPTKPTNPVQTQSVQNSKIKICPPGYWNYRTNSCKYYPENHPSHYTNRLLGYRSNEQYSKWCQGWFFRMWNKGCSAYPANHPSHYDQKLIGQNTSKPWHSKPYFRSSYDRASGVGWTWGNNGN